MPTKHVALLRGINVGKAKRVAMADLRELFEELGYRDTRTLLNSGNVVFTAARATPEAVAKRIEAAMTDRLKVPSRTLVLTAAGFSTVVQENSLDGVASDPTRLFVSFCHDTARLKLLQPLARENWKPDALVLGSLAAYMWCPKGLLESRLPEAVGRILGDATTMRNWATVKKIAALL